MAIRRAKRPLRRKPAPAAAVDAGTLSNAIRTVSAPAIRPQLATLSDAVPDSEQWLHEIKFDGYRIISYLHKGRAVLITRGGHDWTSKFSEIADALATLPVDGAILDGELIAIDSRGRPTFNAMQNALRPSSERRLHLHLFDIPYCNGFDLRRTPLIERKALLQSIIQSCGNAALHFSEHVIGRGNDVFMHACEQGLEGTISKRIDSHYVSARTVSWLKNKCKQRQEFVIGGYSEPEGSRSGFGALVVGYYDGRRLVYCGRVGTGFDHTTLKSLYAQLVDLERPDTPFAVPPAGPDAKGVHWVEPDLIAEVEFSHWTDDSRLRHPSFIGLRADKPAREVGRETPHHMRQSSSSRSRAKATQHRPSTGDRDAVVSVAGVRLTNPQRIMYPAGRGGLSKRDVANYYESVADWILPHIVNRPLTIVRCPKGLLSACFYQRHLNQTMPPALRGVGVREGREVVQYLVIDDLAGLISLVQHSTLEIHPWGSHADDLERPDRLIFDIDPGPGVPWKRVTEAAVTTRDMLAAAGLTSFVQTSGGKGLHVVVPVIPRADWEEAKAFCQAVAQLLSQREPTKYTASLSKAKRAGRIFIDYLRNGRGATSVASYSTRAREGGTVACPLRWEELSRVRSADQFTIRNVPKRLASLKADPWKQYFTLKQHLPQG